MTLQSLFSKNLQEAQRQGKDHNSINCLCGCTERKIVLTEAEVEAAKITWQQFMTQKLWNVFEDDTDGWMFGSPKTQTNIGIVPYTLARIRLGLNRSCWGSYIQVS